MYVDQYVVRIKQEYAVIDSIATIIEKIPEKYRPLFSTLWNEFHSLSYILNSSNFNDIMRIYTMYVNRFGNKDVRFASRYRDECLQTILRKEFFDTILIIKNVVNVNNYNIYNVLDNDIEAEITFKYNTESDFNILHISTTVSNLLSEEQLKREEPLEKRVSKDMTLEDIIKENSIVDDVFPNIED